MLDCMNWPPSRGPNPHTHDWTWTPGVIRKDLPAPKPQESAVVEKKICDDYLTGKPPKSLGPLPKLGKIIRHRAERPVLEGLWEVWYQVKDVAGLTVEQAHRLVKACREERDGKSCHGGHFENWILYQPRPLWVDLTYPLTRGVRLLVKPLMQESGPCKVCKAKYSREGTSKRTIMSPGYFLWTVAKEYERIYAEHEKYGVWGHTIDDLGFERISIRKDGVVDLFIGS